MLKNIMLRIVAIYEKTSADKFFGIIKKELNGWKEDVLVVLPQYSMSLFDSGKKTKALKQGDVTIPCSEKGYEILSKMLKKTEKHGNLHILFNGDVQHEDFLTVKFNATLLIENGKATLFRTKVPSSEQVQELGELGGDWKRFCGSFVKEHGKVKPIAGVKTNIVIGEEVEGYGTDLDMYDLKLLSKDLRKSNLLILQTEKKRAMKGEHQVMKMDHLGTMIAISKNNVKMSRRVKSIFMKGGFDLLGQDYLKHWEKSKKEVSDDDIGRKALNMIRNLYECFGFPLKKNAMRKTHNGVKYISYDAPYAIEVKTSRALVETIPKGKDLVETSTMRNIESAEKIVEKIAEHQIIERDDTLKKIVRKTFAEFSIRYDILFLEIFAAFYELIGKEQFHEFRETVLKREEWNETARIILNGMFDFASRTRVIGEGYWWLQKFRVACEAGKGEQFIQETIEKSVEEEEKKVPIEELTKVSADFDFAKMTEIAQEMSKKKRGGLSELGPIMIVKNKRAVDALVSDMKKFKSKKNADIIDALCKVMKDLHQNFKECSDKIRRVVKEGTYDILFTGHGFSYFALKEGRLDDEDVATKLRKHSRFEFHIKEANTVIENTKKAIEKLKKSLKSAEQIAGKKLDLPLLEYEEKPAK